MQMLSDDDVDIRTMSHEELDAAWDLWFDLAQETNAFDPAYTHGVLVRYRARTLKELLLEMPPGGDDGDFERRQERGRRHNPAEPEPKEARPGY